jgi:pyridinium-3,5-bisthiocarboxylic acid mononucleotide nickel chelatase
LRILYFDCFSGAAGDMILGALIDAGVPLAEVRRALGSLAITPDAVWTDRVLRAGLSSTKFCVRGEDHQPLDHADAHRQAGPDADQDEQGRDQHSHDRASDQHDHRHSHTRSGGHRHGHGHDDDQPQGHDHRHYHVHRSLSDIVRTIDGSALSGSGKERAKDLFRRLADAEARVHDLPIEQVHLHEVGALDSIVDIVGTVFALESLQLDRIVASPLNVGRGTITSAHGLYPVPAPATMRLLLDAPIYSGQQTAELVTPTGALLITSYAGDFGPIPPMRVRQVGYGAGSRDFAGTPNVLRVLIGDADTRAAVESVVVIEAEIDDMNPQIFGVVMDRLLDLGALDVFYTAVQMKKNRPGTLLSVIAPPDIREALTAAIFRETTTIGVRYREMSRECLDREVRTVHTPVGDVRIKIARRDGEILNASAEFDDCVRLAAERGRPVKEIQAMALKAFYDS